MSGVAAAVATREAAAAGRRVGGAPVDAYPLQASGVPKMFLSDALQVYYWLFSLQYIMLKYFI